MTLQLSPIQKAIKKHGADHFLQQFSDEELTKLKYQWEMWARPNQLPPEGDWLTWFLMAGRGNGKTRTGAETIRAWLPRISTGRIALLGRTPADVRDVMIEGESGLMNVFPNHQRPTYHPSSRRLIFYNGAQATTYSSENPDQLRGPQHEVAWTDELGTFRDADAWDNLQMGLRLGLPRQIVTSTPRPTKMIRELVADSNSDTGDTVLTRGTTYENRAHLSRAFFSQVIRRYEGTRRGQQEIEGLLLEDVPGALWQRNLIQYRLPPGVESPAENPPFPGLRRVVVGVDPSVSDGDTAAECGIVVAAEGTDGFYYVLADRTLRGSPHQWASEVVVAYHSFACDRIVAEQNQGGKMVETTVKTVDPNVSYRGVYASVGKQARAEPVAALYEQGRVLHLEPFTDLEDQMCVWVPGEGESPDRMDALVWAMTELALQPVWDPTIPD